MMNKREKVQIEEMWSKIEEKKKGEKKTKAIKGKIRVKHSKKIQDIRA